MTLRVNPERPLDSLTGLVLRAVHDVVRAHALPYFLCGAMARDLLTWHLYGIPRPTATRDVDLAISVTDWASFNNLKAQLIATGEFSAGRTASKLRFQGDSPDTGYPVDLIPFGGVATAAGIIAWPPDQATEMTVIGYEEALRSAASIQIDEEYEIPVVSFPMLTALKLFSWHDRRRLTPKDAEDFAYLLGAYERVGAAERLFGNEMAILESVDFDIDNAVARLLGHDVANTIDPKTHSALTTVLDDPHLRESLITQSANALRGRQDAVGTATTLLGHFRNGLAAKKT